VPGDPESGAVYVLDRKIGTWYSFDFEDEQFGCYSVSQFEKLLKDYKFLDLIERPGLLAHRIASGSAPWSRARRGRLTEKMFRLIKRTHSFSVLEVVVEERAPRLAYPQRTCGKPILQLCTSGKVSGLAALLARV
jgi:hypothetical protein